MDAILKKGAVVSMADPTCCAIVVAAGQSTRMAAGVSKQFLPLLGIPAVIRTLLAFQKARHITRIVIVCRVQDMETMHRLSLEYEISKLYKVVQGGITRQRSVAEGIAAAGSCGYYAIHDGARPLVTPAEIDCVVEDCWHFGASALAVPVKDTIKAANAQGFVTATPNRAALWAVQTPQVFEQELYREALRRAEGENMDYTDDCQLVEHTGGRVHLCMGSYTNIKLTTKEDVAVAVSILHGREEENE